MDGTGDLFEPLINSLNKSLKLVVVRYPLDKPLNYKELVAFAEHSIPKEGSYALLGESFSGPIALSLACKNNPRLIGVILCCSFIQNPRPTFSTFKPFIKYLPFQLAPKSILSHILMGRFSTAKLRKAFRFSVAQVSPNAFKARLTSTLTVQASDQLRTIQAPILYLRASEDKVVPKTASKIISSIKPSAHIVEIEAPHFLLQAAPIQAAKAILSFLANSTHEANNLELQ